MEVTVEYRVVGTFFKGDEHGNYKIVATEPGWSMGSVSAAIRDARKAFDYHMKHGANLPSHPELDIINGHDKLVISIHAIVMIDGKEVEITGYNPPIQSLVVSEHSLRSYPYITVARDAYNNINRRSRYAYTCLY